MKKIIKLMVSCLVFCILCIGIGKFFRYLLSDDASSYTRVTFHEMYEQDNIDILFVGSSLCYKGFIPEIFDEKLGLNTFNAGTSGQHLDPKLPEKIITTPLTLLVVPEKPPEICRFLQ